jgi:phage-related protein
MEIIFINRKINKFIESLSLEIRSQVDGMLLLLEEYNYNLGMPFSKALGGKLFELRVISINHIRFIYTFYNGKIYVLHGFTKKTERISKQDMEYAQKQLRILLH